MNVVQKHTSLYQLNPSVVISKMVIESNSTCNTNSSQVVETDSRQNLTHQYTKVSNPMQHQEEEEVDKYRIDSSKQRRMKRRCSKVGKMFDVKAPENSLSESTTQPNPTKLNYDNITSTMTKKRRRMNRRCSKVGKMFCLNSICGVTFEGKESNRETSLPITKRPHAK